MQSIWLNERSLWLLYEMLKNEQEKLRLCDLMLCSLSSGYFIVGLGFDKIHWNWIVLLNVHNGIQLKEKKHNALTLNEMNNTWVGIINWKKTDEKSKHLIIIMLVKIKLVCSEW